MENMYLVSIGGRRGSKKEQEEARIIKKQKKKQEEAKTRRSKKQAKEAESKKKRRERKGGSPYNPPMPALTMMQSMTGILLSDPKYQRGRSSRGIGSATRRK